MKISVTEKQQLLSLYKEETGNPINQWLRNSDYLDWLEDKIIELKNRNYEPTGLTNGISK